MAEVSREDGEQSDDSALVVTECTLYTFAKFHTSLILERLRV